MLLYKDFFECVRFVGRSVSQSDKVFCVFVVQKQAYVMYACL